MPQIQYPFIDIAVHPAVRTRFAAGEAIALFSQDMAQVLWANGEGARLFGYSDIYDLMDNGPDRGGVAFRQLSATARQLETTGDRRSLVMRVTAGFASQAVSAEVSLVEIRRGEIVVIFSAPVAANSTPGARIAAMLKGFEDPDTHMAVIDDDGVLLAASPDFEGLGILPETARSLIAAAVKSGEGLIKRPIASAAGYLPAAIGRLSIDPPLNLLFCVETVLGRMDPPHEVAEPAVATEPPVAATETQVADADSADAVEQDVSLPGIDEDEMPVEGLVETFNLGQTDIDVPDQPLVTQEPEASPLATMEPATVEVEDRPGVENAEQTERAEAGISEAVLVQCEGADDSVAHETRADDFSVYSDPKDNASTNYPSIDSAQEVNLPAAVDRTLQPTELAADEASPAAPSQNFGPEHQIDANLAEAAINDVQTAGNTARLADPDGGSVEDVAANDSPDIALAPSPHDDAVSSEPSAGDAPYAFANDIWEPVEHVEADRTEAAMNQGEDDRESADLANLDGVSAEEVAAYASPDTSSHTDIATSPLTQLAADQAESSLRTEAVETSSVEPEDHVEADVQSLGASGEARETANAVEHPAPFDATEDAAAAIPEQPDHIAVTEAAAPVFQPADDSVMAEVVASEEPASDPGADIAAETLAAVPPEPPLAEAPTGFQFRREGRPVRFVWKLDAQGRFSEVSEEFARTVGPHAGDINGVSYRDLDSLFNLDPNNEIAALLERRDTWSGRTIRWPVEGTDLVVPVDLAALPTYSRNREFDGFRGFGIIRVADAERDPNASGLTLAEPQSHEITTPGSAPLEETDAPAVQAQDAEEVTLTVDGQFENRYVENEDVDAPVVTFSNTEIISTGEVPLDPEDDFRGEMPALTFDVNSPASFSRKIIQLEERRARARDGLTANEQNAFREIARQLEPFGKRPNESLLDDDDRAEEQPHAAETPAAPDADQAVEVALLPDTAQTQPDATDIGTEVGENAADAVSQQSDAHVTQQQTADQPDAVAEAPKTAGNADDIGLTSSAADQIPLAILIHAGDRLVHANAEFKRFAGYESLEALEAAGGLDALITRREGPEAGVYMTRGDGTHIPVSARLQSVRYESAKLLMLTLAPAAVRAPAEETVAEDQTMARKLSALQVEADELRSILETATDGVVVLDGDGRIRSMNRSASALFNFEDAETRGKPFAMLFAHESQKSVQDYLNGLIGHGVASVLNDGREVIGREASGGFIPLFMTMGRMPGSSSYCAVIRDITQWKRSEEELKSAKRSAETANQHKSDFLARVSHEIRTPLNAIIGFSDMIASEHFGPAGHSRYVEYANDIGRSGRHVLDIVNDLLDISKIEAGEMDLEFAAVGINDCISEAVSLVQPQANAQRVIIRTSLSQSVPDVVADLRSIKQIAINILANAIRFTPSGGQIVVSTAYEPTGSVALRIRDTGVGMSKADLEQAMKPFGQVSPGTRHRGDGTGLGLPLTKAMAEANRALFSIQSSPNEGTLVEIVFPPQRVLAD